MDKEPVLRDAYEELQNKIIKLFVPHADDNTNVLEQNSTDHYLRAVGLRHEDLEKLRAVHVAGTKGKGSTCAMVERILRECGYHTGLFTSPHLCDMRERIRINGEMVETVRFYHELEWVYNRLKTIESDSIPMPRFFRLITLVCFRIFLQEDLDVVVIETGIGGKLDPTNFLPSTYVCGISTIGFDHMDMLGNTLGEIASEKAGIFKPGCLAFTVPQYKEAMDVIKQQALDTGIQLTKTDQFAPFKNFNQIEEPTVRTGFQAMNATLAIHLARAFELVSQKRPMTSNRKSLQESSLKRLEILNQDHCLPNEYLQALSRFQWAGRAQIIPDDLHSNLSFYIDGAHTTDSLSVCSQWFASETKETSPNFKFLLFHCLGEKNPQDLLQSLYESLCSAQTQFDHVFFTPLINSRIGKLPGKRPVHEFSYEQKFLQAWKSVLQQTQSPSSAPAKQIIQSNLHQDFIPRENTGNGVGSVNGDIFPSLPGAIGWFRSFSGENHPSKVRVLITGSLYLVGDVLKLLKKGPK